jgi:cytochrome bd-type quinol oxidase subunit 2
VTRHVGRGVYVVVAVVACPLVAWNLAVEATNRGFGWRGFVTLLLAVPVIGAVLAAAALRRKRREATLGAIGAVIATFMLFVALIFATLSSR